MADCLSAGLTEEDLQIIAVSLKAKAKGSTDAAALEAQRIETLYTARDLVRQGVSSATATELINSALAQNYDAEAMRQLRASLAGTEIDGLEARSRLFASAIAHGVKAADLQKSVDSPKANSGASTGTKGTSGTGNSNSSSGSDNGGNGSNGGDNGGNGGDGGDGGNGGNGGRS